MVENQTGRPLMRAVVTLKPMPGSAGGELTTRTHTYRISDFPSNPEGGNRMRIEGGSDAGQELVLIQ
jgi:hypothetical protein